MFMVSLIMLSILTKHGMWTSHLTHLRFSLLAFKKGMISKLKFNDNFKAEGEVIGLTHLRNAENALVFQNLEYMPH